MARGTQLSALLDMLRYECRHAAAPATGVDTDDRFKHLLRRTQDTLYQDYDWPFLNYFPTLTMAAGQRYYDFPSDFNLESVVEVNVQRSGRYVPVDRGITPDHLNAYDSDADARSDPVLAWDVRWTGSATQIEVWPIPSTNGAVVRFSGKKTLRPLVAATDVADLDDYLIVLHAAAEELLYRKSPDAETKAALAQKRLTRLMGRSKGGANTVILGGGTPLPTYRRRLRPVWDEGA